MKRVLEYIKASIDIEDYRGHYIAYEGDIYVIYDSSDDSKIGSGFNSVQEAELYIDSMFESDIVVPTPEQRYLGKEAYYKFIDYCKIDRKDVTRNGIIKTTKMFYNAEIDEDRLKQAIKSFSKKHPELEENGVYLYVTDTGYDYKIGIDYIM